MVQEQNTQQINRRSFLKGIAGVAGAAAFGEALRNPTLVDSQQFEPERDPILEGIEPTKLSSTGLETRTLSPISGLTVNSKEYTPEESMKILDRLALNIFSRLETTPNYDELENNLLNIGRVPSINQGNLLGIRLRNGEDVMSNFYGRDPQNPDNEATVELSVHDKDGWELELSAEQGQISLEDNEDGTQKRGVTFTKSAEGRFKIIVYHEDEEFEAQPSYPGLRTKEKAMSVELAKDFVDALTMLLFTRGDPYLWRTYKEDIDAAKMVWGNPEANYTILDISKNLLGDYFVPKGASEGLFIGPSPIEVISTRPL